jgi:hypothetical protein
VNKILLMNYGLSCEIGVTRQMWMVHEGDIVVSAIPVEEHFLDYLCEVSGIDRDTVTVLNIGRDVDEDALVAPDLVAELRALMGGSTGWELLPAAHTEGVAALAELLGLPKDTGLRFTAQRGPDLLNRKSHFRQLAAGAGAAIPAGSIVTTEAELAAAVERHLPETGTVIVKRDDDLGGAGNRALTTKEAGPLNGVRETVVVNGNRAEAVTRLWQELAGVDGQVLVVESYHHATEIFYFEYLIGADGVPRVLDTGLRRDAVGEPDAQSLVWVGLEIPADLPPGTAARALTESGRLADLAARLGYRGHLNVDGILTEDGELYFNEINARWGGCTSLHDIGEKLFGPNYADHHVVSGLRIVTPMRLSDAVELLRHNDLHFTRETGDGAVVLGYDQELSKATECVLTGRTRARVREIEERLRAVAGTVTDPALVE